MRDALAKQGAEAQSGSPQEFAAFLKTEHAKWARVVKEANIRIQ